MLPVHKIDFDSSTWQCVLNAVRGMPFVRHYMEKSNLRFAEESIRDLPGDIQLWLAKSSTSGDGWFTFDKNGFVLSEYVGRNGKLQRTGVLGEQGGGLDLFFEGLLPEFTLLNIADSWSSGAVLNGCKRQDVTVYIQDRYLFADRIDRRRSQLGAMLDCIKMRLDANSVESLRVIICCSERGLKYNSPKDNLNPTGSWDAFEEELVWLWEELRIVCHSRAADFIGGFCGVMPADDFPAAHLVHCRFMIWDDLTLQWAVGPRKDGEAHWVRSWSHLGRCADLMVSANQWGRFREFWNGDKLECFSSEGLEPDLEWDVWD